MNLILNFIFIFYIGSTIGWLVELIFRRIVHGKWVNPGFLIGPYLPIYGFGLCALTGIYLMFYNLKLPSIIIILLMGASMTLIELIGGLSFVNKPVKLWDYSNRWGNYKGIICPLFSLIWTIIGAIYYYFIAGFIIEKIEWFHNNMSFSFILGFFSGIIIIDYIYSTKMLSKIKKYAKENNIEIKTETLPAKKVSDSETHQLHVVIHPDINGFGRLFGGRLLEWIDEVAGATARRHCGRDATTVAIDNLYFKSGAYLNDIIVLIGKVTHVGHTSMEVRVDTYREEQDGTRHPINRAYFVMVAMGDNGKPTPVPGLILENEGERMEWDNAIKRRELRLVRKKEGF